VTEEFNIPDNERAINSQINSEQEYDRLHENIKWSMHMHNFTERCIGIA